MVYIKILVINMIPMVDIYGFDEDGRDICGNKKKKK